jgi:hypothetical protein
MKQAFEGDHFLKDWLADLISLKGITTVMETGTETGASTVAFAEMVPKVFTCDLEDKVDQWLPENVERLTGESHACLDTWLTSANNHGPILFFLDAHLAPTHTNVLKELESIAFHWLPDCVIVVHDFKTPHDHLGFDYYDEHGDLNHELIRPDLERIFPLGYTPRYNNDAVGAMRGVGVFFAS